MPKTQSMRRNPPDYIHDFQVNDRVRFQSENPEREPLATVIEVGYCAVRLAWDDGHEPTTVLSNRLGQLERL
jgi:hypothetical protein